MSAIEIAFLFGSDQGNVQRSKLRRQIYSLVVSCVLLAPVASFAEAPPKPTVSYLPNTLPTTVFGPPAADILVHPTSNFLECSGGPIALCYYSGPPPAPRR